MKKILAICCLGLMFVSSCKKKDSGLQVNTFSIGGIIYSSVSTTDSALASPLGEKGYIVNAISALYEPRSTMTFALKNLPFTSDKYLVVSGSAPLGQNQIQVQTYHSATGTTYVSTGSGNIYATVSVTNNQISINMPSTWAVNPGNPSDSTFISANVSEK